MYTWHKKLLNSYILVLKKETIQTVFANLKHHCIAYSIKWWIGFSILFIKLFCEILKHNKNKIIIMCLKGWHKNLVWFYKMNKTKLFLNFNMFLAIQDFIVSHIGIKQSKSCQFLSKILIVFGKCFTSHICNDQFNSMILYL